MNTSLLVSNPSSIYPAYCFSASPTYHKWVKLTATDVHALRREPTFEGMRREQWQNFQPHTNMR